MAKNKLNISPPEPPDLNVNLSKYKNIAIGKGIGKMPEPIQVVADVILNPPGPQDIINAFLTRMPSPQLPISREPLTIPQPDAPMIPVGGTSLNGKPMYANLEMQGTTWQGFNGATNGFQNIVFDTVLISCQQNKNVVVTEIQGSDDGAVIEYSGLNNYNITIDIIVTGNKNHNGIYPSDVMSDVVKMLTCPKTIKVNSWYLQMFSIYEISILNYDVSQQQGGISQQVVTINAMSSKRTTLIIQ